jgi:hypothetical protein
VNFALLPNFLYAIFHSEADFVILDVEAMTTLSFAAICFYFISALGIALSVFLIRRHSRRAQLYVVSFSFLSGLMGVLLVRIDHGRFSGLSLIALFSLTISYLLSLLSMTLRK